VESEEGFEHTFALYVLNRSLMAEGLRAPLENAPAPVIVNLCGAGQGGRIHWDDLQLTDKYRGLAATMQGARASVDLAVDRDEARRFAEVIHTLTRPTLR
ncbi:short-chain dehydrogenase, partial [Nonomuraea sp. RK-328]|nr:short-chain dehydrogenase [Nonomuraea sp. RK-328]